MLQETPSLKREAQIQAESLEPKTRSWKNHFYLKFSQLHQSLF